MTVNVFRRFYFYRMVCQRVLHQLLYNIWIFPSSLCAELFWACDFLLKGTALSFLFSMEMCVNHSTEMLFLFIIWACVRAGSRGVVLDPHHQAGAAAAAATGGSAGGSGERQRPRSPGEAHQRHPGAHGRAPGLRLHFGQLHHPADEDPSARGRHRAAGLAAVHPVEAVGFCGVVVVAQLNPDFRTRRHEEASSKRTRGKLVGRFGIRSRSGCYHSRTLPLSS